MHLATSSHLWEWSVIPKDKKNKNLMELGEPYIEIQCMGLADAYSGDELVPSQLHGVYVRGRAG